MHIAEGILPLSHALAYGAAVAPLCAVGALALRRVFTEGTSAQRALCGMAGAVAFAVTLLPMPIPVIGATSHLCATPLLALLLGPRLMLAPIALVLVVQAVFFAHGGLTTLGANILTLGVIGPGVALGAARGLLALRMPRTVAVALACGIAHLCIYASDAVILGAAFAGEQSFTHWFTVIALGFAPAQLALSCIEAVASALIVEALARRRRELLPRWLGPGGTSGRRFAAASTPVLIGLCAASALFGSPSVARAETAWQGLDKSVIEAAAQQAGHPPSAPILPVEEGELGLFVFMLGGFIAGVVVGSNWHRLTGPRAHAIARRKHAWARSARKRTARAVNTGNGRVGGHPLPRRRGGVTGTRQPPPERTCT